LSTKEEKLKVKDSVTVKLYRDGKLIYSSSSQSKVTSFLRKVMEVLEKLI